MHSGKFGYIFLKVRHDQGGYLWKVNQAYLFGQNEYHTRLQTENSNYMSHSRAWDISRQPAVEDIGTC